MSILVLLVEDGMPCAFSDQELHYDSSNLPERGFWLWGRAKSCDLVIWSRTVSKEHCAVSYSAARKQWELTDIGSTNGTWFNGKRIESKDPKPLQFNDRFTLGTLPFEFVVLEEFDDTLSEVEPDGEDTIISTQAGTPQQQQDAKSYGDSLYLLAQWFVSGQTTLGKVERFLVAVALVAVVVVVVAWVT